jgi:pyridoxamine 5'-phosphate oxidase
MDSDTPLLHQPLYGIEHLDPFALFTDWFTAAKASEINDPDAMSLATVDAGGQPSCRMVLLKGFDHRGFVFYTNQHSRKAAHIRKTPRAALTLHWKSLRRQVRIEGVCEMVTAQESDAYFASRSRMSQLGAWASDQSAILPNRGVFEEHLREVSARFDGKPVPRPPHWSGTRVRPTLMEFWQDMPHRLHDRTVFYAREAGGWDVKKLYP